MDKQAVTRCNKRTRLHSCNQGGVISTHSSTTCGSRSNLNFFHLHQVFERAVEFLLSSEELLPVECSAVVSRFQPFLSTEELAQLAHQENEPRLDTLAFRFPSYDREHAGDRALVATAEFYMNFRMHQTRLSYTESDYFILQKETETIR